MLLLAVIGHMFCASRDSQVDREKEEGVEKERRRRGTLQCPGRVLLVLLAILV